MAVSVPIGLRTHSQKVCSLYKRAVRNMESWFVDPENHRYESVIIRSRFDANKNIKDLRVAKELLKAGEEEYESIKHPQLIYFAESVGGVAFERNVESPDWVLDYWHPTEKAMYPKYFALREKRKKEYIEFYNKQYPNAKKHFEVEHDG